MSATRNASAGEACCLSVSCPPAWSAPVSYGTRLRLADRASIFGGESIPPGFRNSRVPGLDQLVTRPDALIRSRSPVAGLTRLVIKLKPKSWGREQRSPRAAAWGQVRGSKLLSASAAGLLDPAFQKIQCACALVRGRLLQSGSVQVRNPGLLRTGRVQSEHQVHQTPRSVARHVLALE